MAHRGNTKWFLDRARIVDDKQGLLPKAMRAALNQVGEAIAAKARAKAPVRKIYAEGGQRRRTRAANTDLINAAIASVRNNKRLTEGQRTAALYLLERHPQEARVAIRRHGSVNRRTPTRLGKYKYSKSGRVFAGMGTPLLRTHRGMRAQRGFEPSAELDERLSARGRYEIRSGRALTNAKGELIEPGSNPTQVNVGGRLKKSIGVSAIAREGSRMSLKVSATAPYAKFVEFPTRHNAAQPFLLPALHEEKRSLAPALENELRARGLKG